MATFETGHAVNIANYKIIIGRCEAFAGLFQPSNPLIAIAAMNAQWTNVEGAHSSYLLKLDALKIPVDNRELSFVKLNSIVTRANNIYGGTLATDLAKADVNGLKKKITGSNVRIKRLEDGKPDPNHVSNSQQSFVNKIYNFEQMVNILRSDTNYAPNEDDLKIAKLEFFLTDLKTENNAVEVLITDAIKFRITRNHGLYDEGIGVVDVVKMCKKYVKGVFGARSQEAKSVTSVYLKRRMKMKPL
jgi:hypothetical protein